jgi:hypothetical protein
MNARSVSVRRDELCESPSVKTWRHAVAVLGFVAFVSVAQAQYSLDWWTVGGSGVSSGGVFTVSGTVAQPEAGAMSGGNFSVVSGFWSLIAAVQTPGEPLLTITRLDNSVVISWPSPSTGFGLQENPQLGTTNWTTLAQVPADDGVTKRVTIAPPVGSRYYRLKQ